MKFLSNPIHVELLLGLVVALTAATPSWCAAGNWLTPAEELFSRLGQRRHLSVIVVGFFAIGLRLALLPIRPVPNPCVQDEFSYLLAADTFAHGRLTNPPHPMWQHLETFHVLQQPTYASKYPPGQGLFLAVGQVVAGNPFWGVVISVGVMCSAICWMLQGWFSPGWALLGSLIAMARFGPNTYWGDSYWGGAVAACGGALVLGALPRIKQHVRSRDAVLMGVGLALLANTRPYEGLVFSLPAFAFLTAWALGRERPGAPLLIRRTLLPLLTVLLVAGSWMAYYNWRVTGSSLRMPYSLYMQTYDPTPNVLLFLPRPLPQYRHAAMRDFELKFTIEPLRAEQSPGGFFIASLDKMASFWLFFVGPVLTAVLLPVALTLPYGFSWKHLSRDTRFLAKAMAISIAALLFGTYYFPHYSAPASCLIVALALVAMRRLHRSQPSMGRSVVGCVAVTCIVLLVLGSGMFLPQPMLKPSNLPALAARMRTERARSLARLQARPGQHLVVVRYGSGHNPGPEWVYNGADIDAAKVIWARDMGRAKNDELLKYFHERTVWLLEPDRDPPHLVPYPATLPLLREDQVATAAAPPLVGRRDTTRTTVPGMGR